jgi:hypothetical protein
MIHVFVHSWELHKKWFILVEICTSVSELQKQYTGYIFYISLFTYSNARPADSYLICGCLLQYSWRQSFSNARNCRLIKLLGIHNRVIPPLTLWAFVACYGENFTFTFTQYNTEFSLCQLSSQHKELNPWASHLQNGFLQHYQKCNEIFLGRQMRQNVKVYSHFRN